MAISDRARHVEGVFQGALFPEAVLEHASGSRTALNYYLGALVFNAFPIPQREAGARQTMRYAGELASEGWCIVIFPEGRITDTGEIARFQPGVGMLASRLNVPVVPVGSKGSIRCCIGRGGFRREGDVRVRFGPALQLRGDDYDALARQVEEAVRLMI